MSAQGWLADTQMSYDTVAASYADLLRDALATAPYERAILALFAQLVHTDGGGPVADVGCGPGRITAHLRTLGVDAVGIDLSPAMIDIARRDHPGLQFEVGSMTDLDLADASVTGLVAWFSLIHIPDDEIPTVFAHFHRVLRPGGALLLGFHVGDGQTLKTQGYGGHPMKVYIHRRPPTESRPGCAPPGSSSKPKCSTGRTRKHKEHSSSHAASPNLRTPIRAAP